MEDSLEQMKGRLKEAVLEAERLIEERQARIREQMKDVKEERHQLGAERRQLDDERASIEAQQADLHGQLGELRELRVQLEEAAPVAAAQRAGAAPASGWPCCTRPKTEKANEMDVTLEVVSVTSVSLLRVSGAGHAEVNGIYRKQQGDGEDCGEWYFEKEDEMAIYWQKKDDLEAWFIGSCLAGSAFYFLPHADPHTLALLGYETYDGPDTAMPGAGPPPLLEIVA